MAMLQCGALDHMKPVEFSTRKQRPCCPLLLSRVCVCAVCLSVDPLIHYNKTAPAPLAITAINIGSTCPPHTHTHCTHSHPSSQSNKRPPRSFADDLKLVHCTSLPACAVAARAPRLRDYGYGFCRVCFLCGVVAPVIVVERAFLTNPNHPNLFWALTLGVCAV